MKTGLTELAFILDKSGSMCGLETDTIGGFNAMLSKQQEVEGECRITTVLFDNCYELLHDRVDIKAVKPITQEEYQVGGTTALLDAVGITIHKIAQVQKNTAADYRAEKVLFVIITDGQENASREYSSCKVKELIKSRQKEDDWEFIFLGANIDAVEAAGHIGIPANRAQNYHADCIGTAHTYAAVACSAAEFRAAPAGAKLNDDWNLELQEDYASRASKR